MCYRVVSGDPLLIVYCLDQYKTQRICDEAVDNSLAALKLVSNSFVAGKMIKKVFTALSADENILCFNEDSGNVIFNCNQMGILSIDLNNINLDNDFDEDNPDAIIPTDFWFGILNSKNANKFKK